MMNIFLLFTTGWILIIFNIPSVIGALSLFSEHIEDVEFNKRGMQMYLVGYTKAVFMLLILLFTSYKVDGLEQMETKDYAKIEFFTSLKELCEINSISDFIYCFLGIFILKLTKDILRYLHERDEMELSSILSEERNDRLTSTFIEMRSFRERE